MIEQSTFNYIERLAHSVPLEYCIGALILFLISSICFFVLMSLRKALRFSSIVLLVDYVFLLLCSTVLFRCDVRLVGYNLKPFRSYVDYFSGNSDYLLPQVLLNIFVFIPIGVLLKLSFWNQKWWQLLILGGLISISIETLQLLLHNGFCEVDDVLHNMMGCLFGIMIFRFTMNLCRKKA